MIAVDFGLSDEHRLDQQAKYYNTYLKCIQPKANKSYQQENEVRSSIITNGANKATYGTPCVIEIHCNIIKKYNSKTKKQKNCTHYTTQSRKKTPIESIININYNINTFITSLALTPP